MSYIVVLNPLILGAGADKNGDSLNMTQIAAATALVAGVMTILMGVVARFPLALAAGLGVNAMVAYEIAPTMTWADAMGLVVIEGVLITIFVLTGLREALFRAVPTQLKIAIGVGIGLFLTLIGLVDAGFVRATGSPAPPVQLGLGNRLVGWPSLVFVIALLVTLVLVVRKVRGRDPDRHRVRHRAGDHRRGDLQGRADVHLARPVQPARLEPQRPEAAGQDLRPARPRRCSATSACSAPGTPASR